MNRIAIILARGGSKRLPRKNIRMFFDKPMVAWTIEAAIQSKSFERILLSTDSEEIASIGIEYGAEAPFLRNSAFDDHSSSSEATIAALGQAENYWGETYEVVAQLMANCPLRTAGAICNAMTQFFDKKAFSQISCFKFGWMNPWWSAELGNEGHPKWLFPKARVLRSQDLPPLFCPSGAIWIAQKEALKNYGSFYAPGHVFREMSWASAMDIDDEDDWLMAEACMLLRDRKIPNV